MDPLLKLALAGTSRGGEPRTETPVDGLFDSAPAESAERRVLLRAGALAIYERAGRQAQTLTDTTPESALEEHLSPCSARAADIVRGLIEKKDPVLFEALDRLRRAGLRLPHGLLPLALSTDWTEARPALETVLGERGRWLARLNPEWVWATGDDRDLRTIWEEGTLKDRVSALRRVREQDPALGREWLSEAWRQEKAETRAAMLEAFEVSLSPEDETFLESVLGDRSVKVRAVAADLLARLPGSAYARRNADRADSIIAGYESPSTGFLGRRRSGSLLVEPLSGMDKDWRRDLPGDDAPPGVGEKMWNMVRTLGAVSPTRWERRFRTTPEELVAAAHGEWEAMLLAGWCKAAGRHGDENWAWPLWERCYRMPDDADGRMAWEAALFLAPLLPQEELATVLPGLLYGRAKEMCLRLAMTLRAVPAPWRPELSGAYMECLRKRLEGFEKYGQVSGGDPWLLTLPRAASALSPESFDQGIRAREWLGGWVGKGNHIMLQWNADLTKLEETVELRRKLVEEIPL